MSTITTSHNAPYLIYNKQIQLIKEKKPSQTYTKHDQLFKRLLETFFAEFIEAFFPQLHEKIDFSGLTFLSEEMIPDRFDDNTRILDIVAQVKEEGTDCAIVVHVEPQSYVQTDFHERMLYYFIELRQKVKKPIIPIAIFSYDQPWDEDAIVIEALGDEVLRFKYRTIHLRKLSWRTFIKQENPVAAALLSKMGYHENERVKVKVEFLRMLTRLQISREEQTLL